MTDGIPEGMQGSSSKASQRRERRRERRREIRGICESSEILRGNMRRVIVINSPSPIFREAIFILKDDFFQTPGLSRRELMHQAKEAADGYIDAYVPKGSSMPTFAAATSAFVLGAALTVLALRFAGIL